MLKNPVYTENTKGKKKRQNFDLPRNRTCLESHTRLQQVEPFDS